jgi:UDP-N-acetylmuramyl pentapeptide phosphotransferase/UDP-N-acetylglucosamine-1-phosphate transferase
MNAIVGRAAAWGAGAVVAQAAFATARGRVDSPRWQRINHRGRTLTLLEGPALAAGAAAAVAVTPGLPGRARAAGVLAILGAGAVGTYDDLGGLRTSQAKGFAGHLAALRSGRLTSGVVKAAGIGATSLAAAALVPAPPARARLGYAGPGGLGNALLGGAVVAGFANLINLFDLRPGRALKVGLLHAPLVALPGAAGSFLAGPFGAAVALLPVDLREDAMLGDAGANALGAALGTAVLLKFGFRGRMAHLVGIAALTAASEKVSFTQVIASKPALRWFDELGRTLPPRSPESAP